MTIRFTRLTRLACRNLEPGRKLIEHGISFERLVTGDGRYTVNVMVDGVRVHRVIGKESDGVTRQQCEDFIERARTDARHGRLNLPRHRKTVLGFAQAARVYLEKLGEEDGKDLKMKVYRLSIISFPFFGTSRYRSSLPWTCNATRKPGSKPVPHPAASTVS